MYAVTETLITFDPNQKSYKITGLEYISRPKITTYQNVTHYVIQDKQHKNLNVDIIKQIIEQKLPDQQVQIVTDFNNSAQSSQTEMNFQRKNFPEVQPSAAVLYIYYPQQDQTAAVKTKTNRAAHGQQNATNQKMQVVLRHIQFNMNKEQVVV